MKGHLWSIKDRLKYSNLNLLRVLEENGIKETHTIYERIIGKICLEKEISS